ncbi:MAG: elongation factor P maturation arginine rhamnosyltransferase EarP [Betaproteobacteria bacterium]|uniref:Protein-arginine rhamnosyltransferase n=1 Tax=Candidatus Proximibacter danicus TaxID=2954365 RepID=A0A9D7PSP2_9PROT|nr:elongation factor P maturation arginine rhamnosyltransferase EarP [Candidatus Proximibacter danicus]
MPLSATPQRWDIFCTVIDNYGDIGVCWRLARQLVAEHGHCVRLWVDDLASFAPLCPGLVPALVQQQFAGVEIRRWTAPFPYTEPAEVVIEAFGCALPESYVAAMARGQEQTGGAPHWINLEYLSAESWVAECHGLTSPHPRLPLTKHFFIPGFDEHSAGLLRERGLMARHASFDTRRWWKNSGGSGSTPASGQLAISLFAYENRAVAGLLDAWVKGSQGVLCLVPESRVLKSVSEALGKSLAVGEKAQQGHLELRVRPFVQQEAYDDLLLACDLNLVRGEDSLVRAIWAGKPFVWHIYPQDEDAHIVKLDAFLDRYCAGLSPAAKSALRQFWHSWNRERTDAGVWHAFQAVLPELAEHTRRWRDRLAEQIDLTSLLTDFCRDLDKNRL